MDLSEYTQALKANLAQTQNQKKLFILGIILLPIVIGRFILKSCREKSKVLEKEKESLIKKIENHVKSAINKCEKEHQNVLDNDTYLIYSERSRLNNLFGESTSNILFLQSTDVFSDGFQEELKKIHAKITKISEEVKRYNKHFVDRRKKDYDSLFKRSPHVLDDSQKTAVVVDDKHNLVVAGAGSGKTEVLINRIAYLIERKPDSVEPKKILALALQSDAEEEIKERLKRYGASDVEVRTFHSLGNKILQDKGSLMKESPQLKFPGKNGEREREEYIESLFSKLMTKTEIQKKVVNYMEKYGDDFKIKEVVDFETKEEYFKYIEDLRYKALDGQKVRSQAERVILNFFVTHNIDGKRVKSLYEHPAEWMSYYDEEGKKHIPAPDFFLKDFNIYWEHWAINKNGDVPEWFEGKTKKERADKYKKGMKLKKEKFENQISHGPDHNKPDNFSAKYGLIETTSDDYYSKNFDNIIEKRLLEGLKKQRPDKEFVVEPIGYEELVKRVWSECREGVKSLPKHIAAFILIAKTYDLDPPKIQNKFQTQTWTEKQKAFGDIAIDVFDLYNEKLRNGNEIDFTDMINRAVEVLNKNKDLYKNEYDQILIDEFQDISTQRYKLVKALMSKCENCKLFCVGDDWQSIMGFTGSNLEFFTKFEEYFDHPARTDLEVNYRSNKSIVDLGTDIIKHNPEESQIMKKTVAFNKEEKEVRLFSSKHREEYYKEYYEQIAIHCVEELKRLHDRGFDWKDLMVLRRIVKQPLVMTPLKMYAEKLEIPITSEKEDYGNKVRIMSVHKSKGLQAKIVFILNVDDDLYGFPCKLENPDIYEPAIDGRIPDRLEEERRLFYVAVTRGMQEVIMYDQAIKESQFIKEIKSKLKVDYLSY